MSLRKKTTGSFTAEECEKWKADPTRNPRTNRKIKKDGAVYKQLEAALLERAIRTNDTNTIREILTHYKDPHKKVDVRDLVVKATRRHATNTLQVIFEGGISPNLPYLGADIIFEADFHIPTMRVFLEHGVNVEIKKNGNDLLYEAIKHRYRPYEVAQLLIEYGFEVRKKLENNATYIDVIFFYSYRPSPEDSDLVRLLIREGVPLNDYNYLGNTTLHSAIIYGSIDIVRILLEAGANPNARNKDGLYPLENVKRYKNGDNKNDLVSLLLEYGADPTLETVVGVKISDTFDDEMKEFIEVNSQNLIKEPEVE